MSYDLCIRADAGCSKSVDAAAVRADIGGLGAVRDRAGKEIHLEIDVEWRGANGDAAGAAGDANQITLHVPYSFCSESSALPPEPVFARALQIARKLGWEVFDPQQDCLLTAASHKRFRWQLPMANPPCAKVSPDGGLLLVGAGERVVAWELSTGRRTWSHPLAETACSIEFEANTGRVFILSNSPITQASTLECLDSRSGASIWRLTRAKVSAQTRVAVSNGRVFVDGDGIVEAELEPVRWGRRIEIDGGGKALRWSVAAARVASSSPRGVSVWKLPELDPERHIDCKPIVAVALCPNGALAALGLWGKQIQGWSLAGNRPSWTVERCGIPYALAFSSDGKLLLAGNDRGSLQVIDAATGATVRRWKAHHDLVKTVQFVGPELTVTTARDDTVSFSNPAAGKLVATLAIESDDNWVLFTPAGDYDGAGAGVRFGNSDALPPGELKLAFALEAQDPARRKDGLLSHALIVAGAGVS
jgi:WD40 repeat protein